MLSCSALLATIVPGIFILSSFSRMSEEDKSSPLVIGETFAIDSRILGETR